MSKKYCLMIGTLMLAFICVNVYAEDYNLGKVLVSATRTEAYQAEVGSSTTVITKEDLENSGKVSVADVLQSTPGISLRRNSVYGGVTSVDIRGAKSGQTMVMIDGVEIYDPIAIDRDFDLAHLTTDNIEQIEIVRGPQSPLYGANAMTGVINIITKKGQGKPKVDYSLEGGAFDTFGESLGFSGANDQYNYAVFASRVDSEGVNKARDGSEKDGYKSTTVSANLGANILDDAELFFTSRYTDAEFDIDEFDNSYQYIEDDINRVNFSRQFTSKAGLNQVINENWDHQLSFSFINMNRRDRDPADTTDTTEKDDSRFKGDVKKIQWQHNISVSDKDIQTLGFDYQEERGASFADTSSYTSRFERRSVQNRGYYFQTQLNPVENLFTTAGVRIDNHDIFAAETNYRIALSYIYTKTNTRFKSSYGTAFKAPSIYQLYDSTNGNEKLEAETSKGSDIGFEQQLFEERLMLGATYFNNKFKDLISWTPDFSGAWTGKYTNIKEAYTRGCELEAAWAIRKELKTSVNYTYTATKDKDTGKEFGRRPKNQAGAGLDWKCSDKGNIYFGGRFIGERFDNDSNTVKLKKYYLFDVAARYNISEGTELFWRIENVFDRQHELISGFDGLSRAVYAGIKGSF
ncbi:MAG: TonB-dependent receptor [Candidatus Omnitrophota bacterium]